MAITFPPSPSASQVFASGSQSWTWNGTVWAVVAPPILPIFSATAPSSPTPGMYWVNTNTFATFCYYNTAWVEVSPGSGGVSVTYSDVAPTTPAAGSIWIDTTTMTQSYYYSSTWVEMENMGASGTPTTGSVIQTVYAEFGTYSSSSSNIPQDNTIPQLSEGVTILSSSITPTSVNNKVIIRTQGMLGFAAGYGTISLFKNSGANAIYAGGINCTTATHPLNSGIEFMDSPSSTSSTTYAVNVGAISGAININGDASAQLLGGVSKWVLILQEIKG